MTDDKGQLTSTQRHLRSAEEDLVRELKGELFSVYTDQSGHSARSLALVLSALDRSAIPRELGSVHRILSTVATLTQVWEWKAAIGDQQQLPLDQGGQQPSDPE
jgi:hypothetical protein